MVTLKNSECAELCFGECSSQTKATNDKNNPQLSLCRRDGGQPDRVKMSNSNNHQRVSIDIAEIAHCLTLFSHPVPAPWDLPGVRAWGGGKRRWLRQKLIAASHKAFKIVEKAAEFGKLDCV